MGEIERRWLTERDNTIAEQAAEIKRLLQVVDDSIEYVAPGWGGDARCRSFELAALCQNLYKSERELEDKVERLKKEQFEIAGILKCDDLEEGISTPSNLPNIIRDKVVEIKRLKQQLAEAKPCETCDGEGKVLTQTIGSYKTCPDCGEND